MTFSRVAFSLLSSFLVILPLYAEDGERGRLPDGRAYRTDAQGNQLVDYIAELELKLEGMNQRVAGLEDELEEKQNKIRRMERSGAQDIGVSEKTIFEEREALRQKKAAETVQVQCPVCPAPVERVVTVERSVEHECPRTVCPDLQCPKLECPRITCPDTASACQAELRHAQNRVGELERAKETELTQLRNESATEASKLRSGNAQLLEQVRQQADEVATLKARLGAQSAELDTARLQVQSKGDESRREVDNLSRRIRELEAEQERLQREVDVKAETIAAVRNEAKAEAMRASLHVTKEVEAPRSPVKNAAVESFRSTLNSELNTVRATLRQRDELFAKYQKSNGSVRFKPARAVSARGNSLEDIQTNMRAATSVRELVQSRTEISEIRGRLQEDIGLMKRLVR